MKFPCERRSTRLGPSTWRRIAMLTLRTADDAYLSAICNGVWRKNSRVQGSPISTGFPRTNGNAEFIGLIIVGSARPNWTLLAVSCLLSATMTFAMQSIGR
jgi:hypothetical protein